MSLELPVIRLALDLARLEQPRDAATGRAPMLAQGSASALQIGIFLGDAPADVAEITRVAATFSPLRRGGSGPALDATPYLIATTTAVDATLEATSWAAGSKQHVELEIDAELLLPVGRCWVTYTALDNGHTIHLGGGPLDVHPAATGQLDLIVAGDPARYRMTVYGSDHAALNLADYPEADIVWTLQGTSLEKTLSGGAISLGAGGDALVELTPDDTRSLSPGSYRPFAKFRPHLAAAYETILAGAPQMVISSPLRAY